VARTVELLRESSDGLGLVTANGGNLYKHVHTLYAGRPPDRDFRFDDVQDRVDALPARVCLPAHEGDVTLESYSVMYDGDAPAIAHCACLTSAGERTWVNLDDPEIMTAMTTEEFCGRAATIDRTGRIDIR
jgi:acetyl-CoA C-acetyltransferase